MRVLVKRKILDRMKRHYRPWRNRIFIFVLTALCVAFCITFYDCPYMELDLNLTRRAVENQLRDTLKEDKGSGCEIPRLDPFAKEVAQFDKYSPKIICGGQDWVKCYHSKCKVVPAILRSIKDIECSYRDIVYVSDLEYYLGSVTVVQAEGEYVLTKSDHVKITCTGARKNSFLKSKWVGYSIGFRTSVERRPTPKGREDSLNVLIFGFDSTSKNGFIRKMPQSYKYLTKVMGGTVLNGYNIVGDGTPAALFPILTGKTELELPDMRKKITNNRTLDMMPFIFYKLKDDGYRTAYFEDSPSIGTFQYRFNGFSHQPADHYLRAFSLEEAKHKWSNGHKYCIGDTPQYKLMINITEQFLRLDGKKFIFTFVVDISHDDYNMMSTADDYMVQLLQTLRQRRVLENTLVMIMGDHGPRFAEVRDTLQGKLEERLPLMCILLPDELKRRRPNALSILKANVDALTTPHDVHATILDALDMTQHMNPYRITGADFPRGMSLLEPIPRNRSCSEAGIEPHWCSCLTWSPISEKDAIFKKAADAFLDYINSLTEAVRSECLVRTLTDIKWVIRQRGNSRMLSFLKAMDEDGYIGKFGPHVKYAIENYQVKVVVGPGRGVYEASMKHIVDEDRFQIDTKDISRTNAYGEEPSCISAILPHLSPYCYCRGYQG